MTVQTTFETRERQTVSTATDRRGHGTAPAAEGAAMPGPGEESGSLPLAGDVFEPVVSALLGGSKRDEGHYIRTQFLRRVAHDIASPSGVTTTALEELANDAVTRPELVAMARRGLRRLLRLSEQLALAADFESGAVVPDPTLEDARTIVKTALDQAVSVDGRRDVAISCAVPDVRVPVNVDRRLVVSAIREVIGNALRLASARVLVELVAVDGVAVVRVHDDGPGFAPEALRNLGQRFHERSTSRGLGLSLSIARDVLALHDGSLAVEVSSLPPGRRGLSGAAVVVTLPIMIKGSEAAR